jgi:hypothetical protein
MSGVDLHDQVLAVVRERGPIASRTIALAVGRRKADVQAALRDLHRVGLVLGPAKGWTAAIDVADESPPGAVPSAVPVAGNRTHGLTAAELYAMPRRRDRVKAIWAAMSPAARERAWRVLSSQQRADALAVLLDASSAVAAP